MRRAVLAVLAVALVACVPASEELPPAGAAGFDTVPSPATGGEPFVTADGWTVRVERFVAQVSVAASPVSQGYGSSEPYLFDAQRPARLFARALPVGPARVSLSLYGRYISRGDYDYVERVEHVGVDGATAERFRRLPDEGRESPYTPGPSVLLAARAERDGRVVTFDLALNVTTISTSLDLRGALVEVREDALTTVDLPLHAERLFTTFEEVADADADGDGRLTASELLQSGALLQIQQRMPAVIAAP